MWVVPSNSGPCEDHKISLGSEASYRNKDMYTNFSDLSVFAFFVIFAVFVEILDNCSSLGQLT